MEIGITVEGSRGLNWESWRRLAQTVEACGYHALYRSDHFVANEGPPQDALDLWISLAWLAMNTQKLDFGSMVSPMSFRHPAVTARMAAAVNDLAGGRLILGIGAGGWGREHQMFGIELLDVDRRLKRFEEGTEVIWRLFHSDQPTNFQGQFFTLRDAILLPRPQQPKGPRLLIGGNGQKRTLRLAAKFADEWNGVYLTKTGFQALSQKLDEIMAEVGRNASEVTRSMLTGCIFGRDSNEVERNYAATVPKGLTPEQHAAVIAGTAEQIVEQIVALSDSGIQRLILSWHDLNDVEGIELLAEKLFNS